MNEGKYKFEDCTIDSKPLTDELTIIYKIITQISPP